MTRYPFPIFLLLAGLLLLGAGCGSGTAENDGGGIAPTVANPFGQDETPATSSQPGETSMPPDAEGINISTVDGRPVSERVLGTNIPAWLNPTRLQDETFSARARAAGVTLTRIPGGSWSNYYDWLACERNGEGIDEEAECFWPWAARPSDFIRFLQDVPGEVMYTINANGTAQEAAALVAFFNGSPEDETAIGVDLRGRDWGTAGQWAALRDERGFSEPLGIKYWEIGNEFYGGKPDSGTDCPNNGWEDVWTCDGIEYINGIEGQDGFRAFYDAMKSVDPSILIGAVGTTDQNEYSDWGNEVLIEAGDLIDFYVMHHYAYFNPPNDDLEILHYPQRAWPRIMSDFQQSVTQYAGGRDIPVAVTEYNLISFHDLDNRQLMTRAVNALYLADTIGQFIEHGVDMANHWTLASGEAENGTDYGLVDADTFAPSPAFFAFHLWSHFGDEWLPVETPYPAQTELSVYAGRRGDGTYTLLAVNKQDVPITAPLLLNGEARFSGGEAYLLNAETLDAQTVTFNEVMEPAADLANAPPLILDQASDFTFPPYSITLLILEE